VVDVPHNTWGSENDNVPQTGRTWIQLLGSVGLQVGGGDVRASAMGGTDIVGGTANGAAPNGATVNGGTNGAAVNGSAANGAAAVNDTVVGGRAVDGFGVGFGRPQRSLAFAALAVDAGRLIPVETLLDRIWGSDPPRAALRTTQTHLAAVRGLLRDAGVTDITVVWRQGGYLLATDPDHVDLHRFRRLSAQAREAGSGPDQVALWRAAIALWNGEPLLGLPGSWASRTRERWWQEYRDATLSWADAELCLGRANVVIDPLTDLIDRYPLMEALPTMLMRALYAVGRRADAIDCYTAARIRLDDELGEAPGPELTEVYRVILRRQPAPLVVASTTVAAAGAAARSTGTPGGAASAPQGASGMAASDLASASSGTPAPDSGASDTLAPAAGSSATPALDTGSSGPAAQVPGAPSKPARPRTVPSQLPADVRGFLGRTEQLARLDAIAAGIDPAGATVVISAVAGTAGVGKTALALHWAHRIRHRFPDGQLYVNLRGFDQLGEVASPQSVIRRFLDALGVPARQIPADPDAQVSLYRAQLADRAMLVVLDNARDAEQVRPLLPHAAGCLVLVTSRNSLAGLVAAEGAVALPLDPLTLDEAHALLTLRLGPARVEAEPAAVDELVTRCARLPLALTIVASRASTEPRLPLAALVRYLRDDGRALDALSTGEPVTDLRAVFSWSYRALSPEAARLFRLLGLPTGPDISASAAASLSGATLSQARALLAELTTAHLLVEDPPGRYAFHDLLRAYARRVVHDIDSPDEQSAAIRRMLDHYLHTAYAAESSQDVARAPIVLPPLSPGASADQIGDHQQALAWFTAEHTVLLAAVEYAATFGYEVHAWQLALTMETFLYRRGLWQDHGAVCEIALTVAMRLADPVAQIRAHLSLSTALMNFGNFDEAEFHLGQALCLTVQVGDRREQGRTHYRLGILYQLRGNLEQALVHHRQSLDLCVAVGDLRGQAAALNSVGWQYDLLGEYQQALTLCQQALIMFQELGKLDGLAYTWHSVGYAHLHLGDLGQALPCYQQALALFRELGHRTQEAKMLAELGPIYRDTGDIPAARAVLHEALVIFDQLEHPDAENVRSELRHLDS
jgi:tetratricopeptide (TPR) repeat protein